MQRCTLFYFIERFSVTPSSLVRSNVARAQDVPTTRALHAVQHVQSEARKDEARHACAQHSTTLTGMLNTCLAILERRQRQNIARKTFNLV